MNINLPLAFIWFFVGVVLVIYHQSHPDGPFANMLGTGLSGGWVAIALGLYNLVRWWSIRSDRARRRSLDQIDALRLRDRERDRRPRPPQEPDPNFNFAEPPASPDGGPRGQEPGRAGG